MVEHDPTQADPLQSVPGWCPLQLSNSRLELNSRPLDVASGLLTWLPESHDAAIVRSPNAEFLVEFPSGHIVYCSRGWISDLRVSPRGDQVAFFEHPVRDDDGGYLRVVDKK